MFVFRVCIKGIIAINIIQYKPIKCCDKPERKADKIINIMSAIATELDY